VIGEVLPTVRGRSDAKGGHNVGRIAPLINDASGIVTKGPILQHCDESGLGAIEGFAKPLTPRSASVGLLAAMTLLGEFYAGPLGKPFQCIDKFLAKVILHKPEAVACGTTGVALVKTSSLVRHDSK
jgi:hypothetical protein